MATGLDMSLDEVRARHLPTQPCHIIALTRFCPRSPHPCAPRLAQLIKNDRTAGGKAQGGRGRGAGRATRPYARGKGGRGMGDKACNNCGTIGHLAGQCPEPAQCHACGSTAHAVADCPNKDKTCSVCGKVGHLKAKCRAVIN
jgi:hypothetical protein